MIIKTLSRKSNTGQLVNYIFKYVFREEQKPISPIKLEPAKDKFIIRHNIRSRSVKGFVREFQENESYRLVHRKDSVKLFHTIISFSNKDKEHINDKLLKDIAQKFITERGLNNLYVGTKHVDKDHVHLHIAVSGTQLNGRSSRISKQQLHHIKITLDKYQREKYPELKHSLPEHGKGKRLAKETVVQMIKVERQSNKQTIIACLENAYSNAKSPEHFISLLKESGHNPYYRNGSLQGIRFEGQTKFRLNRLGFDKARLQTLEQVRKQEKSLGELKKLREDHNRNLKRTIKEPAFKERSAVVSNKDEARVLENLSAIRSRNDNREVGRNAAGREYGRGHIDMNTPENFSIEDEYAI